METEPQNELLRNNCWIQKENIIIYFLYSFFSKYMEQYLFSLVMGALTWLHLPLTRVSWRRLSCLGKSGVHSRRQWPGVAQALC